MMMSTVEPGRATNRRVMLDKLLIGIAGRVFAIISTHPTMKLQAGGATQNFFVNQTTPDMTIEARWDDLSGLNIEGEKIFDSGSVWQLYQNDETYLFRITSPAFGSIPYKAARVLKDFTWGEVLLHAPYFDVNQPVYPLAYPLDELLFINFLALGGGVEIHSCGLIDSSGRGHLFAGQSEAGKTTMARLWQDEPGVTILSDDRIVLCHTNGRVWMYGTPWHGEARLACPASAPLKRIYFLRHGNSNELIQQAASEAVGRLFACSFLPFFNPQALDFTLGFFEETVKSVPCCELRSLPDKRVVEFIQQQAD